MKGYLKPIVEVGEGQFDSENTVVVRDYNGIELWGLFSKQFIRDGKLEVNVVVEHDDKIFVSAPQHGFNDMRSIQVGIHHIWIKKPDITYLK